MEEKKSSKKKLDKKTTKSIVDNRQKKRGREMKRGEEEEEVEEQVRVESRDVLKLIFQFLSEQNLVKTSKCLLDETDIDIDFIAETSVSKLATSIIEGKWEDVLDHFYNKNIISVSEHVLEKILTQVALEMIELRDTEVAKAILRETETMQRCKNKNKMRRLEALAGMPKLSGEVLMSLYVDGKDPRQVEKDDNSNNMKGASMEEIKEKVTKMKLKRRKAIAEDVQSALRSVKPNVLMNLLGDAFKWRRHCGFVSDRMLSNNDNAGFDVFSDRSNLKDIFSHSSVGGRKRKNKDTAGGENKYDYKNVDDDYVRVEKRSIGKFGKKSSVNCFAISPDGLSVATGTADGFVELWKFSNGKLRTDLKYQNDDELLLHENGKITALAFSPDFETLASADSTGMLKVWRIRTGNCVRSYPSAHHGAITKMEFSADGNGLLTSGFDGMVRLHGLKSGKTLKEYVNPTVSSGGITEQCECAIFCGTEKEFILAAYSNGLVLLFDAKTAEIVKEHKHPLLTNKSGDKKGDDMEKELHVSEFVVKDMCRDPLSFDKVFLCGGAMKLVSFDANTGSIERTFTAQTTSIPTDILTSTAYVSVSVSRKGEYIYAANERDTVVRCWRVNDAKFVCETDARGDAPEDKETSSACLACATHPQGNAIVTLSSPNICKLFTA